MASSLFSFQQERKQQQEYDWYCYCKILLLLFDILNNCIFDLLNTLGNSTNLARTLGVAEQQKMCSSSFKLKGFCRGTRLKLGDFSPRLQHHVSPSSCSNQLYD